MKEEEITQINLINWVNFNLPDVAEDIYHFANERFLYPTGGSHFQYGRKLKRMGVKKGVFDLFLAIPKPICQFSGLWLELKTEQGKPTKEQLEFMKRMILRGYEAKIAYGFDDAKNVILNYLDLNN